MEEVNNNIIFVSGLPYTTQKEEVIKLFEKYGNIRHLNFPIYQDSGKSRGYCHVEFCTSNSATAALNMNKFVFKNRYLDISLGHGVKQYKQLSKEDVKNCIARRNITLFVKNLPYNAKSEEIGEFFMRCGKIRDIRMVANSATKLFKGFCYIDFIHPESLYAAVKLNGADFQGRQIKVDISAEAPKRGFRIASTNISRFERSAEQIKSNKIKKVIKRQKHQREQIKNLHTPSNVLHNEFKEKIKKLNIF